MREVLVDRLAAVQHERQIESLRRFEHGIIVLSGEGLVLPTAPGAVGIEIERDKTVVGPALDLLGNLRGWRRGMLPQHSYRCKAPRVQLAGAQDEAIVEIGPDGVLLRGAVMSGHRLRAGRGECDV